MAKDFDEEIADPGRSNILGNFIVSQLHEHFPDYTKQDLIAGTLMAATYLARTHGALERDVVRALSRMMRARMVLPSACSS